MIVVPIYPEMLSSIEDTLNISGSSLNRVTAGYFNSCIGLGEAIGPVTASLLSLIGFRHSQYVVAVVSFAYCIAYFCMNGKLQIFHDIMDDDYVRVQNEVRK